MYGVRISPFVHPSFPFFPAYFLVNRLQPAVIQTPLVDVAAKPARPLVIGEVS